jgi:hypothetical protein
MSIFTLFSFPYMPIRYHRLPQEATLYGVDRQRFPETPVLSNEGAF